MRSQGLVSTLAGSGFIVRSASHVGSDPEKRSQYHLYEIEPGAGSRPGARFRIGMRARGYDPTTGRFSADGELVL